MALFGFGSKKKKVREMLESGQFDLLVQEALKDKKVIKALIELLDDSNPGVVGDALLTFTQILETDKNALRGYMNAESFKKLMSFVHSRNPYIRENAMLLAYGLIKEYPTIVSQYRDRIVREIQESLAEGTKDEKGFLLVIIGELGLKELKPIVEEYVNVEDKVVLPFEGKRWVPLGQIAKETLEKLS